MAGTRKVEDEEGQDDVEHAGELKHTEVTHVHTVQG